MEDGRDELVTEMIGAAVQAGAYRVAIRGDQRLAAGFGKLADRHSARAATLAERICDGAGLNPQASVRAPTIQR